MRHLERYPIAVTLLAALTLGACESNPPLAPVDYHAGDLDVVVTRDADHVHTLGAGVTFTVAITDHDGRPVTDFEAVAVERRLAADENWRAIELELAGDVYRGTYVFTTSGEHHLRVMAQEHGAREMRMLHEMHDPLQVGRAHGEMGSWRVEFENFPGHVHEGEEGAFRFWVTEEHGDGDVHAVEGMTAQIHVREKATGDEVLLDAEEHEAGVYEAHHLLAEAGEYHVGLHMSDAGGKPGEVGFDISVAHGH